MTGGAVRRSAGICLVIAAVAGLSCGTASAQWRGQTATASGADLAPKVLQVGVASYYGQGRQGHLTASGERFDKEAMTAAHPWLPFGTRVRVKLIETGQEVVVVITDRMPGARRVIDLSVAAARELGILRQGVARVTLATE